MNFGTYILVKLITLYKYLVSPLIGHSCRYLPTCSEYSIEALKTYGFFKGLSLSIKRILSFLMTIPPDVFILLLIYF